MSNKSERKTAQELHQVARESVLTERESLALAEQDFFETELGAIKTISNVAEARYKMGFTKEAQHTKQEALKGISTVRYFLDKSHLIAPEKISAFAKRCDELEILVKGVGPKK